LARKFVTTKELRFIENINRELIQRFIGSEIIYYRLSREETPVHDVYGEAISKTWYEPVRVNCLVRFDNPTVNTTDAGNDSVYTLTVMIHTAELTDRNLAPKDGDFVEHGGLFFEVASVTQPQTTFGQIQARVMTKLVCVSSREAQFKAGAYSSEGVDNSHPVENATPKNVRE
jgi:hypothetical protein